MAKVATKNKILLDKAIGELLRSKAEHPYFAILASDSFNVEYLKSIVSKHKNLRIMFGQGVHGEFIRVDRVA